MTGAELWIKVETSEGNKQLRESLEHAIMFFGNLDTREEIPEHLYPELFSQFSVILCRPMIAPSQVQNLHRVPKDITLIDSDEEYHDIQTRDDHDDVWFSLVRPYDIFSRFLEYPPEVSKIKPYMTQEFAFKILELLLITRDQDEKNYLKVMIHRIYKNYIYLRQYIRKIIRDVFYRIAYEGEKFESVDVLLAIYDSFIRGFTLPLRNEHRTFLLQALLPLHKSPQLCSFHFNLFNCVEGFIFLEPTLFKDVVTKLGRMWPLVSQKQLLFLQELDKLVEAASPDVLFDSKIPVFQIIAKAIESDNRLVADAGLSLLSRYYICDLTWDTSFEILPIVYPRLVKTAVTHWYPDTKFSARRCLEVLWEKIPEKMTENHKAYMWKMTSLEDERDRRAKAWREVESAAIANMNLGIPLMENFIV